MKKEDLHDIIDGSPDWGKFLAKSFRPYFARAIQSEYGRYIPESNTKSNISNFRILRPTKTDDDK